MATAQEVAQFVLAEVRLKCHEQNIAQSPDAIMQHMISTAVSLWDAEEKFNASVRLPTYETSDGSQAPLTPENVGAYIEGLKAQTIQRSKATADTWLDKQLQMAEAGRANAKKSALTIPLTGRANYRAQFEAQAERDYVEQCERARRHYREFELNFVTADSYRMFRELPNHVKL
jgi:hypothetical protein